MNKEYFLPMGEPQIICSHSLTSADAIIRKNAGDDIQKLFCSHHINCYFKSDSEKHKFVISTYDCWCIHKKYIDQQFIYFLKETYIRQKIDLLSIIKKSIFSDFYILGKCNPKYIELVPQEGDPLCDFLITGYDDIAKELTVYGFDKSNNYVCLKINYDVFMSALWDTPNDIIRLDMRRCKKDSIMATDFLCSFHEFGCYLNSITREEAYTGDKVFGLSAIRALSDEFARSVSNGSELYEPYLTKFYLHKKFMLERIEYFVGLGVVNSELIPFSQEVYDIGKEILELGIQYNKTRDPSLAYKVIEYIGKTVSTENDYLPIALNAVYDHIKTS